MYGRYRCGFRNFGAITIEWAMGDGDILILDQWPMPMRSASNEGQTG